MNNTEVLDVTKIEPRLKHPTIFEHFDQLSGGEAFVIHNDHDPKPLYYQLLGERGNCFTWNYQVNGPEVWEVEIRKNDPDRHEETLGEIVSKDLRKAEVFKKLGLDFCCGGKKSLKDACRDNGLDLLQVKEALSKTDKITGVVPQHDFNTWSLAFLADYIVNVHHAYVKENLPVIKDLSEKVAGRHGRTYSELNRIRELVGEMSNELTIHLQKEELVLFPYIKGIEAKASGGDVEQQVFRSVQEPVAAMENDHDIVGDLAEQIRILSHDYTLPQNACNSFALLYKMLEDFENDLHLHIHLENNILFPKAAERELSVEDLTKNKTGPAISPH